MNRGIRTIIAFFVLSATSPFIGNLEPPTLETSEIARQITVRILTDSSTGSGVIIHQDQHTYIVVTNRHVVDDHQGKPYTILTPDGQTHQGHLLGMGRRGDGETGRRGDGETGRPYKCRFFTLPSIPRPLSPKKGERGVRKGGGGGGGGGGRLLPRLPSPSLGEGLGVRAIGVGSQTFSATSEKPALVRTGGAGERGRDDEDIAWLQFTSYHRYTIAEIADTQGLNIGDVVYAAGFPSWHQISENKITNTRPWGLKAFRWTTGTLEMLPATPLEEGYQLGYTNDIVSGMSGGPILNHQGQLVGINGRSAYPLGGIETFKFVDGTFPPEPVFKQMETFSWGIPLIE